MLASTTTAWAAWSRSSTTACMAQPGRMYAAMDARRHVMGSTEHEPEPGRISFSPSTKTFSSSPSARSMQAMQRTHADNGTVVIQDVHTGQILALAIRPTFNPNDLAPHHARQLLLANHAVSDVYEPGSTFKLVTYAAALDQHIVKPDDMIDCQGGAITFNGRTIHDDKSDHYGVITVHEALEHSSDVAAVKLALRMGPDHFYDYIRDFGFGARTGLELPGETRGLLAPVRRWGGDLDRLHGHGAGDRRDSGATCVDGFDHCQWRRLSAAACGVDHAG
jgi:cell division protein FtsI (penicillin-binding protein 3)